MIIKFRAQLIKKLPAELKGLGRLAYNLWWSWNLDARRLWRELDPPNWYKSRHNPVYILREIPQNRLEIMSKDSHFLKLYEKVMDQFQKAMQTKENLWWLKKYPEFDNNVKIAYLSMEYGIHNSLRIYSGGLGVLSGDHLKESSDLGVPLIAVGFLYQEGYFKQRIPPHGWQEESYLGVNF
ncbi:MAG: DUF3417 domain-containing protein, partial [Candidatus Hodarchaeales archaeon]